MVCLLSRDWEDVLNISTTPVIEIYMPFELIAYYD